MARYNREFLIPYLENICALHLADKKIDNQVFPLISREKRLKAGILTADCPSKPTRFESMEEVFSKVLAFVAFGSGVFFRIIGKGDVNFLTLLCYFFNICGVILGSCALIMYLKSKSAYRKDLVYYEKRVQEYEKVQRYNEEMRKKELPQVQREIKKWSHESGRVTCALRDIYRVNIIPSRYRNIYAAIYLYDWFSTSQADDLDAALNMFVLEEIKDRLDRIISKQADTILNQRIMMANQQKSLEQQRNYSQMMRAKLDQIAASNEERNIYLSMIESNTAATAYFAAVDFIRHI